MSSIVPEVRWSVKEKLRNRFRIHVSTMSRALGLIQARRGKPRQSMVELKREVCYYLRKRNRWTLPAAPRKAAA